MRTRSLLLLLSVGLLTFGIAPSASALPGETSASITVTGGTLSITVPTTGGNLGTRANSVLGGTISGPLGVVQVNDARSAAAGSGWVVSVISTAFTPPSGPAIAASAVAYSGRTIARRPRPSVS